MKIYVDVNILIDIASERRGWQQSTVIMAKVQNTPLIGYISSLTVVLLYLRLEKIFTKKDAREFAQELISGFKILPLTTEILQEAFTHQIEDFEDAIQFISAQKVSCDEIITRDKDFEIMKGQCKIYTPEEYIREYGSGC
ncbi:MAG: PIN domain-containing protein [Candidatus Heimdallarchaeota archaeon]|nr:PIN domain-containing protein [Candidatus Heimdallarchaeota archaeon]